MSKFVTASDRLGLGLRLCWRSGKIESVVLEDVAPPKPDAPKSRHSDGVHIKLGVQVIPARLYERLDFAEQVAAVEAAKASGKQAPLDRTMKELAKAVSRLAADERVTLVESASAWALGLQSAQDYALALKQSRTTPGKLLQSLRHRADEDNIAMRKADWSQLENAILIALGLKPNRTPKAAVLAESAGAGDEPLDEDIDIAESQPEEPAQSLEDFEVLEHDESE